MRHYDYELGHALATAPSAGTDDTNSYSQFIDCRALQQRALQGED